MQLSIELNDATAMALAIARGWQPTVEDESQPMVDDQYPQIPNPVTAEMFIEQIIPPFIDEFVLNAGREQVIVGFESVLERIKHTVKSGAFDEQILIGDHEAISEMVKQTL